MRKLTKRDKTQLFKYLSLEPEYSIYIVGDVSKYGFDSNIIDVFAQEKNGVFQCILMRFCTSYVLYSPQNNYDALAVLEELKDKTVHCISGKSETIRILKKFLPCKVMYEMNLMKLTRDTLKPYGQKIQGIRQLNANDLEGIRQVYIGTNEFREKYNAPNGIARLKVEFENGRYYGKIKNNKIIATAALLAETGSMAMLDNVAVLQEQQRNGYGYEVVFSLCRDFLSDGKNNICVFFTSRIAEKIYDKTGFKHIGKYALMK